MGNRPRFRKRVRPLQRAPDGSAFQKCDKCGGLIPVALMDMHDCNVKKGVKRLKGNFNNIVCKKKVVFDEPRSPFLFFMESYAKICKARDLVDINREAFQKWKNMSRKEQWPYVLEAQKVENVYQKVIHQEIIEMSQEDDDEADSAIVGKFVQHYEDQVLYSDLSHDSDTCDWPLICPWHC